jgi:hypothetical protein
LENTLAHINNKLTQEQADNFFSEFASKWVNKLNLKTIKKISLEETVLFQKVLSSQRKHLIIHATKLKTQEIKNRPQATTSAIDTILNEEFNKKKEQLLILTKNILSTDYLSNDDTNSNKSEVIDQLAICFSNDMNNFDPLLERFRATLFREGKTEPSEKVINILENYKIPKEEHFEVINLSLNEDTPDEKEKKIRAEIVKELKNNPHIYRSLHGSISILDLIRNMSVDNHDYPFKITPNSQLIVKSLRLTELARYQILDAQQVYTSPSITEKVELNGYGMLLYEDSNDIYEGNFKDGQPTHGDSRIAYGNGDRYDGTLSDTGQLNDNLGTMTYANGHKYFGAFKDGITTELRAYTYKSKVYTNWAYCNLKTGSYLGQIENNQPQGFGILTYPEGPIFEGEFISGQPTTGIITYKSVVYKDSKTFPNLEYSYLGQTKNKQPHGFGIVSFKSGFKYIGECINGNMHGKGSLIFRNGSQYIGQFKNNLINGEGAFHSYNNTLIYSGYWHQGAPFYIDNIKNEELKELKRDLKVIDLAMDRYYVYINKEYDFKTKEEFNTELDHLEQTFEQKGQDINNPCIILPIINIRIKNIKEKDNTFLIPELNKRLLINSAFYKPIYRIITEGDEKLFLQMYTFSQKLYDSSAQNTIETNKGGFTYSVGRIEFDLFNKLIHDEDSTIMTLGNQQALEITIPLTDFHKKIKTTEKKIQLLGENLGDIPKLEKLTCYFTGSTDDENIFLEQNYAEIKRMFAQKTSIDLDVEMEQGLAIEFFINNKTYTNLMLNKIKNTTGPSIYTYLNNLKEVEKEPLPTLPIPTKEGSTSTILSEFIKTTTNSRLNNLFETLQKELNQTHINQSNTYLVKRQTRGNGNCLYDASANSALQNNVWMNESALEDRTTTIAWIRQHVNVNNNSPNTMILQTITTRLINEIMTDSTLRQQFISANNNEQLTENITALLNENYEKDNNANLIKTTIAKFIQVNSNAIQPLLNLIKLLPGHTEDADVFLMNTYIELSTHFTLTEEEAKIFEWMNNNSNVQEKLVPLQLEILTLRKKVSTLNMNNDWKNYVEAVLTFYGTNAIYSDDLIASFLPYAFPNQYPYGLVMHFRDGVSPNIEYPAANGSFDYHQAHHIQQIGVHFERMEKRSEK